MEKTMQFLLFSFIFITLFACSKGPSESQILQDMQTKEPRCSVFVTFTDVEIIDRIDKDYQVEIIFDLIGNWNTEAKDNLFGAKIDDPHFFGGPCAGFTFKDGSGQRVKKVAVYEKGENTWILKDVSRWR